MCSCDLRCFPLCFVFLLPSFLLQLISSVFVETALLLLFCTSTLGTRTKNWKNVSHLFESVQARFLSLTLIHYSFPHVSFTNPFSCAMNVRTFWVTFASRLTLSRWLSPLKMDWWRVGFGLSVIEGWWTWCKCDVPKWFYSASSVLTSNAWLTVCVSCQGGFPLFSFSSIRFR